jgi:hypothetical protein
MRIRGFVSYSNRNKATAERTSEALKALGVRSFLAHRNIIASQDWESRIRKELNGCSIFVPVVTKAFWESEWAPQELGAAAIRSESCLIVAVLIGKNQPRGFLKRVQGVRTTSKSIGPHLFVEPLVMRFPGETLPRVVSYVERARSVAEAEARLALLQPFYSKLDKKQSTLVAEFLLRSKVVARSKKCRRELVPAFLRSRRSVLTAGLRADLAGKWPTPKAS